MRSIILAALMLAFGTPAWANPDSTKPLVQEANAVAGNYNASCYFRSSYSQPQTCWWFGTSDADDSAAFSLYKKTKVCVSDADAVDFIEILTPATPANLSTPTENTISAISGTSDCVFLYPGTFYLDATTVAASRVIVRLSEAE